MARKKSAISNKQTKKSSKNRFSIPEDKPLDIELNDISFKLIKPIVVETGWLTRIYISGDGEIEFEKSWTEFMLLMFTMLFRDNPMKFMKNVVDYKILSDGIDIKRSIVAYPTSDDIECEIYEIDDSGYYLEIRKNGEAILKAIKGLMLALRFDTKDVKFTIKPLKIEDKLGENLAYTDVEQVTITETLTNLITQRSELSDINITALTVFGFKQTVKSSTQALITFLMWAYESYGENLIKAAKKSSNDGVGITTIRNVDKYEGKYTTTKLGEHYIYCCNDNMTIIRFIADTAVYTGISTELIEISYKTLKLLNKQSSERD